MAGGVGAKQIVNKLTTRLSSIVQVAMKNWPNIPNPLPRSMVDLQTLYTGIPAVKPHVPLIKFPSRGAPAANQVASPIEDVLLASNKVQPATSSNAPKSKGVAIDSAELPPRYRRKILSAEEMEFIEKGGQV